MYEAGLVTVRGPWSPVMGEVVTPSGFTPGLRTRPSRTRARTPGQGQAQSTAWNYASGTTSCQTSKLRVHSQHVRQRVALLIRVIRRRRLRRRRGVPGQAAFQFLHPARQHRQLRLRRLKLRVPGGELRSRQLIAGRGRLAQPSVLGRAPATSSPLRLNSYGEPGQGWKWGHGVVRADSHIGGFQRSGIDYEREVRPVPACGRSSSTAGVGKSHVAQVFMNGPSYRPNKAPGHVIYPPKRAGAKIRTKPGPWKLPDQKPPRDNVSPHRWWVESWGALARRSEQVSHLDNSIAAGESAGQRRCSQQRVSSQVRRLVFGEPSLRSHRSGSIEARCRVRPDRRIRSVTPLPRERLH